MSKKKTLEEVQQDLNNLYGENVWTALTYDGATNPCDLRHKCGEVKTIIAKNIKSGKLLCSCDPIPKSLEEAYDKRRTKKDVFQNEIDKLYGEGKWKIIDFTSMKEPITLEHHCGEKKVLSRAITMRRGSCTCECELKKNQ